MQYLGRIPGSARRRRRLLQVVGIWMTDETKRKPGPVTSEGRETDPAWSELRGSVRVVHVGPDDGSLRADILARLRDLLVCYAFETDPPNLLLDLSETSFFGGEFMSILMRCYQGINDRHGQFGLCNVRPQLMDELRTAQLDTLLKVYATRDTAVRAMQSNQLCPVP